MQINDTKITLLADADMSAEFASGLQQGCMQSCTSIKGFLSKKKEHGKKSQTIHAAYFFLLQLQNCYKIFLQLGLGQDKKINKTNNHRKNEEHAHLFARFCYWIQNLYIFILKTITDFNYWFNEMSRDCKQIKILQKIKNNFLYTFLAALFRKVAKFL